MGLRNDKTLRLSSGQEAVKKDCSLLRFTPAAPVQKKAKGLV